MAAPQTLDHGTAFDAWIGLSSGFKYEGETYPTLFSYVFGFLKNAGDWADAVNKLIGLVN
ncbi:hypothetical protein [Corynebacterium nasicanis]|uniref:Uncharacterized protein n=1 Tax=Corynebacterium nasicanis TaxID=1448267 RepID=A0ABW1QEY1_9CORY